MATNDERRRVAERLRGLNGNVLHVRRVYESEGSSILCNDQADYYQICHAVAGYLPAEYMHPCDYDELHDLLADLIDPDTTTDTTKTPGVTTKCDRAALLALADDLGNMSEELPPAFRDMGTSIAHRIREACGETQDD